MKCLARMDLRWIVAFLSLCTLAKGMLSNSRVCRPLTRSSLQPRPLKRMCLYMAKAAKPKEYYLCQECGYEQIQWMGKCPSCKTFGSMKPFREAKVTSTSRLPLTRGRPKIAAGDAGNKAWLKREGTIGQNLVPMKSVSTEANKDRLALFSKEANRVLGGGLVKGSIVLLAGEPGIGKSTLVIQAASHLHRASGMEDTDDATSDTHEVIYISGEESPEQIAMRAQRLALDVSHVSLICDVDVDGAVNTILDLDTYPSLIIVDSIQTMATETCQNSAGSIPQIRESTATFLQLAKATGIAVIILGHVTKSGEIAGPRVLEHMVDAVLYLEGSDREEFRLLRSVKNRFGSTSEVGILSMNSEGLHDVDSPSELFISNSVVGEACEGTAVAVVMEGSRPILAEVQCLVSYSPAAGKAGPRRAADGFPLQRLLLICAVIEKRLKISLYARDIYLNVAGGLRISEPSSDLAVAISIISSALGAKVKPGFAFVGEIGLGGELRSTKRTDQRAKEAFKVGFRTVIAPGGKATRSRKRPSSGMNGGDSMGEASVDNKLAGCDIIYCSSLTEALDAALEGGLQANLGKAKKKKAPGAGKGRQRAEEGSGYGTLPGEMGARDSDGYEYVNVLDQLKRSKSSLSETEDEEVVLLDNIDEEYQ